jgi:predicted Rossmann fold nucleotide-binding protein DprA/Smf involved in DNA uptake
VLALVADGPTGVDELARRSELSAADLAATLVELELAGLVTQADGLYRGVMPQT